MPVTVELGAHVLEAIEKLEPADRERVWRYVERFERELLQRVGPSALTAKEVRAAEVAELCFAAVAKTWGIERGLLCGSAKYERLINARRQFCVAMKRRYQVSALNIARILCQMEGTVDNHIYRHEQTMIRDDGYAMRWHVLNENLDRSELRK